MVSFLVTCDEWLVVSGKWSVVSGKWSVASGQWRVVSGELQNPACDTILRKIARVCKIFLLLAFRAGRFARTLKRLAARGCARARRAVGGFACKHASALGHASAMRCIAANRHGSPLRGTRKFTEIPKGCLTLGRKTPFRPFSVGFSVGRSPFPCPLGAAAMQRIARAGRWRWPCLHGPAQSPARRPPTAARRGSGFRGCAKRP